MTIYIANRSTLVTDADVAHMAAAINTQLHRDVAPAWGLRATKVAYALMPPPGTHTITVLDTLDQANALGWHTDDAKGIYGVVGAAPTLNNGGQALTGPYSVCSVLSHEVLEMFCDPACTSWSDSGRGYLVATEVCDPVQSGSYLIAGCTVSDFVTPAFFDPQATGPYNHLNTLREPFTLAAGGYWVQVAEGHVSQKFGDQVPEWLREVKGHQFARAARRSVPA